MDALLIHVSFWKQIEACNLGSNLHPVYLPKSKPAFSSNSFHFVKFIPFFHSQYTNSLCVRGEFENCFFLLTKLAILNLMALNFEIECNKRLRVKLNTILTRMERERGKYVFGFGEVRSQNLFV